MSSEFFEGFMEIHLAGLPNTQAPVFAGKKRFFHIMCQVCMGWRLSAASGWWPVTCGRRRAHGSVRVALDASGGPRVHAIMHDTHAPHT